jgi:hypothetical protein
MIDMLIAVIQRGKKLSLDNRPIVNPSEANNKFVFTQPNSQRQIPKVIRNSGVRMTL